MKILLVALMAGLIPALAVTSELKAQNSDAVASATSVTHYPKMADFGVADNPNTIELNMVNAKALKNFRKFYKANDEKWSKGIDCIAASYISDDVTYFIYYDKKGNWAGSLKIYQEDKLAKDIRKMVKQQYYDYKILVVQEVESVAASVQPTYIITIQGENDIKLIRIQDENMDVYKEFKRI